MEFDGMYYDDEGIFHDIIGMTDEEYFLRSDLINVYFQYLIYPKDGTYYRPINSRQGYIQRGRFRPDNPEKGRPEWAIMYEY